MLQDFDFSILTWLQAHRTGFLDTVVPILTRLGDKGVFWILVGVVLLCIPARRRCGISVLAALLASLILGNGLLKHLFGRARPCWLRPIEDMLIAIPKDTSFPSCHALSCFAAAVVIFHYDRRLGVPALVIAGGVALSRLYLYVHFPTDVLAGTVLGIVIGLAVCTLLDRFVFPRFPALTPAREGQDGTI